MLNHCPMDHGTVLEVKYIRINSCYAKALVSIVSLSINHSMQKYGHGIKKLRGKGRG